MMSNSEKLHSLTPSDLVVLAVVADAPCHGYDLWKRLEAADVKDWAPVSKPQIYYSLKKLQTLALIGGKPSQGKPAGPKKEVFAVTQTGRAALKKNLGKPFWVENRDPPSFMTWAALSLALPRRDRLVQVERRRAFLLSELTRERATLKELEAHQAASAALARSLVVLIIDLFNTELDWLDRFEKDIKATQ